MKKIYLLLLQSLIFYLATAFGQSGTWTWVSGSNQANSAGVYGTQGMPSVNNHPPGLYEPCEWKDKQGNFWIYGGENSSLFASDLWEYNSSTKEWTWVKGDGASFDPPVYGSQGLADPSNTPGTRTLASATWVDSSGTLWLFGGSDGSGDFYNDLWSYNISTNEWTWVDGSDYVNAVGYHVTQGIANPSVVPGARGETASAWTDSLNNLWLFGGDGYDDNGDYDFLNDLMEYNIATNEWTWVKGSKFIDALAVYGVKGASNINNDPGARWTYTKWKDVNGNFWLMGGFNYNNQEINDVWKYNKNNNEWTWMSGTNNPIDPGDYQSNCVFNNVNLPYSRYEQRASVNDSCGKFWMFGGRNYDEGVAFNDLWIFDSQQLKWNWLSGDNLGDDIGSYGNLGVPSLSNEPPARCGADAWWGNDQKYYMFGGAQFTDNEYFSDVWVFNPDTNCVPPSNCTAVAVAPPVANFQSSQDSICANDCINFTDLSKNATSWQWTFSGALDSTSTAENPQFICYGTSGIYNVTLIASNAGGSDSLTFTKYIAVYPSPPTPSITQHLNHDTLYCSTDISYVSYQWYADSALIPGATDTLLIVSKSGNYNVEVKNVYGCNISVGINIVLGIQNYVSDNIISLYPNPATDELYISGNWKTESGSLKLTVFNILGEVIYTADVNNKQEIINCKLFSAGIYFVHVANESGSWIGKFVKE